MSKAAVMFFCPALGQGGADRVLATLLRHLDRSRFAPSLVVLDRAGAFMSDVPPDVTVHTLAAHRIAVAGPELTQVLRRERPGIVCSTHGAANIVVSLAHKLARSSARLVLSERSVLRRSDRTAVRTALEIPAKRITYQRADIVTAVSEGVAGDLVRTLRLPPSRVRVVYNPMVDDEIHRLANEELSDPWFSRNAGVPVIVAVGRLVEIKDYPTLLDAFELIVRARPARLVILGDGPQRAMLEARVASRGLADSVRFAGFDKNPFKYMARATLMLHASRAEGLPGAVIQAMACGTPVVSTDCDHGPREVITQSGRNGFLVPVGSSSSLARRALELLANEELRREMSNEARRAAQRFSTESSLARYEAALTGEAEPC